jgi:hypothetical protein
MTKPYKVIIPQRDYSLIAEVEGNSIDILGRIDIPYDSTSKIANNGTIVTLDKKNKELLLHTMDGSHLDTFDVPFGIAMNLKENVVYIGGDARNGEVCYLLDLTSDNPILQNIDLPEPMSEGKAVDDILILGDKMVLIDDFSFPKFTFEYNISIPHDPQWVKTIRLPNELPYEKIEKGDMNEKWMAYLTHSSSTFEEDRSHLIVSGKCDIFLTSERGSLLDLCLIGDRLYVLTDIGLGYFELNDPNIRTGSIVFIEHKLPANKFLKIDDASLMLVKPYGYELIDLEHPTLFKGSIREKFWSYSVLKLKERGLPYLIDIIAAFYRYYLK